VSLTAEKQQAIEDAGLDTLFQDNQDMWRTKASRSYQYRSAVVQDANYNVRVDDVVPILVPDLKLSDTLTDYLAEEKLRQKYWYTWFAEYILDRLWGQLP
jgi:hypothetical protein